MNTTQHDGGPAFPRPSALDSDGFTEHSQEGMSLRDYFAGMALQGYTGAAGVHSAIASQGTTADQIAGCCYEWADAMLAARKEKP